jgi:Fe-S-cluster containining protein
MGGGNRLHRRRHLDDRQGIGLRTRSWSSRTTGPLCHPLHSESARGERSLDTLPMSQQWTLEIAGCRCPLTAPEMALDALQQAFDTFQQRAHAYRDEPRNPHLCRAGCSHCCEKGAFFAVTLVEALMLALAVEALPDARRQQVIDAAQSLLQVQQDVFVQVEGPPDQPGCRDEALFSKRISQVSRTGASCPLLDQQLCSVYDRRPFLCRAYGFPTDAYAVETDAVIVVRSLCHLYDGLDLHEVIPGKDLKQHLTDLSSRLGGGTHWGRFTSIEAIMARVRRGTSATDHQASFRTEPD